MTCDSGKLEPGKKYDPDELDLVGWTSGDGSGHDGYSHLDYFDSRGVYRGPDEHGIEPIFADG